MCHKIRRIGLEVVEQRKIVCSTTSIPKELPSVEKTRDCVRIKIAGLGLEVVVQAEKSQRTTTISERWFLLCELPSIKEELKV